MKTVRLFGWAVALCAMSAGMAWADAISISGTGQSVTSGLDNNYQITADSTGLYTGTLPGQAVVVTSRPGAWASIAGSQWIGPTAIQASLGSTNGGADTYQTTFSLAGLYPTTALLNFRLLVDNNVVVTLNGTQVYSEGAGNGTFVGFTTPASFSVNSNFVSGVNTLDFMVGNGYGPTGLDLSVSGTAQATPEPATMALSAAGLLAVGFIRRRR